MKKSMFLVVSFFIVSIFVSFNAEAVISSRPIEKYHILVENDDGHEMLISWSDFSWYVLKGFHFKSEFPSMTTMYYYDGTEIEVESHRVAEHIYNGYVLNACDIYLPMSNPITGENAVLPHEYEIFSLIGYEPYTLYFPSQSGFIYNYETAVSTPETDEYMASNGLKKAVQLYRANGRKIVVSPHELDMYLPYGWSVEPYVPMYSEDRQLAYVTKNEVDSYKSRGWTDNLGDIITKMYAEDGRMIAVDNDEVDAYKAVGWYTEPFVVMHAADGRTLNVRLSEVIAYQNVGWSLSSQIVDYYDLYLEAAFNEGLIPERLMNSLDENLTYEDYVDFALKFIQVKSCDSMQPLLDEALQYTSNEFEAKLNVLNRFSTVDVTNRNETAAEIMTLDKINRYFIQDVTGLLVDFLPLVFFNNGGRIRYNFENHGYSVTHGYILAQLMMEIIDLTPGGFLEDISDDSPFSSGQMAVTCFMYSTMTVKKDTGGKYSGGVTGVQEIDDYISSVLDEIIKPEMGDSQKIQAVYDYMVYNYRHKEDEASMPIIHESYVLKANPFTNDVNFALPLYKNGSGVCDVFANMFRLFAIRLGFECNYVSGQYINRDGSEYGHGWNQILVFDQWYWVDVDIACTTYHRDGNQNIYLWYLYDDSSWINNHAWKRDAWPACDKQIVEKIKEEKTDVSVLAIPANSKVCVNGIEYLFDAYNINGYNYFKLRDLAYVLNGSNKSFAVSWDSTLKCISLTENSEYVAIGGEMQAKNGNVNNASCSKVKININGVEKILVAYNIGGNNYFKLRDIGQLLDFSINWDNVSKNIQIDTNRKYIA